MYYLMNKDNVVMEFQSNWKPSGAAFSSGKQEGQTPYGFQNITAWIEGRKASKYNAHLNAVMKRLGCDDSEDFIRLTHAVGINDTFWIKTDKDNLEWKDVSPYQNQFSENVSRLAFDAAGVYEESFSSPSPELSSEGSFRKCFRKDIEKEVRLWYITSYCNFKNCRE